MQLEKVRQLIFQFTPLREGRRCALCGLALLADFNSRPYVRGDGKIRQNMSYFFRNYNKTSLDFKGNLVLRILSLLILCHILLFLCAYLPGFSVAAR